MSGRSAGKHKEEKESEGGSSRGRRQEENEKQKEFDISGDLFIYLHTRGLFASLAIRARPWAARGSGSLNPPAFCRVDRIGLGVLQKCLLILSS